MTLTKIPLKALASQVNTQWTFRPVLTVGRVHTLTQQLLRLAYLAQWVTSHSQVHLIACNAQMDKLPILSMKAAKIYLKKMIVLEHT